MLWLYPCTKHFYKNNIWRIVKQLPSNKNILPKKFALKYKQQNLPFNGFVSSIQARKVQFSFCEPGYGTCGLRGTRRVLIHCGTAFAPDNQTSHTYLPAPCLFLHYPFIPLCIHKFQLWNCEVNFWEVVFLQCPNINQLAEALSPCKP